MSQEQRICPVCGKTFDNKRRKYCSVVCSGKANKNKAKEYSKKEYKKVKRKRRKKKAVLGKVPSASQESSLQKTAREAKEAGMTYGQYVGIEHAKLSRQGRLI